MHELARELRTLGYERTERESPFHDDGMLWTNSYELVCDRTLLVIRKSGNKDGSEGSDDDWPSGGRHTYRNTETVKQAGGYVGAYDWGEGGDSFDY